MKMTDRQDISTESMSASVLHALEPAVTLQSVDQVHCSSEEAFEEEEGLERSSWSSKASHKSEEEEEDRWMMTSLSTLAGHRNVHIRSNTGAEEEDDTDLEANVREALRLLEDYGEDGDEESAEEEEMKRWKAGRAKRNYLDFFHEMIEDKWTLGNQDDQCSSYWKMMNGEKNLEEGEMKEKDEDKRQEDTEMREVQIQYTEAKIEPKDRSEDVKEEQGDEDEWQEAYTAKGRVYYYNRRTRESSWKKPIQCNASSNPPQLTAAAAEEKSKLHRSVLRQSAGYHPSLSVSAVPNVEQQTTLFCCFCGKEQASDQLAAHFQECATATFHKQRLSPLYVDFERGLGLMSEDVTLRSLHYASSFPDPTPHGRPGVTSMRDSLLLLLRSNRRVSRIRELSSAEDTSPKQPDTYAADGRSKESSNHVASQEVDSSRTRQVPAIEVVKQKNNTDTICDHLQSTDSTFVAGPAVQHMEICRYCSRKFAAGRLAKHESVCPRVFGHEGSWGRRTSLNQVSNPNIKNARVGTPPRSAGSMTFNVHKLKEHTLQQSYKEHQATLVLCPCCRRKFVPSGAQQHIAICKGVQNRPKNSISYLRNDAIVG